MDHFNETTAEIAVVQPLPDGLTPTGTQSAAVLFRRRIVVLVLNVATFALVTAAFARLVGAGGWTLLQRCLSSGEPAVQLHAVIENESRDPVVLFGGTVQAGLDPDSGIRNRCKINGGL